MLSSQGHMHDSVDISVLVPVLNEEESLPELNERLEKTLGAMGRTYEILYINDGSTDNTEVLLEGFRQKNPRIKIIEFNRNYGQTWPSSPDSSAPSDGP